MDFLITIALSLFCRDKKKKVLKKSSRKELLNQQQNDGRVHKSSSNLESAFELGTNKNNNTGKLY